MWVLKGNVLYSHSYFYRVCIYFPLIFLTVIHFNHVNGLELCRDKSTCKLMPVNECPISTVAANSIVERLKWRNYTISWLLSLATTTDSKDSHEEQRNECLGIWQLSKVTASCYISLKTDFLKKLREDLPEAERRDAQETVITVLVTAYTLTAF